MKKWFKRVGACVLAASMVLTGGAFSDVRAQAASGSISVTAISVGSESKDEEFHMVSLDKTYAQSFSTDAVQDGESAGSLYIDYNAAITFRLNLTGSDRASVRVYNKSLSAEDEQRSSECLLSDYKEGTMGSKDSANRWLYQDDYQVADGNTFTFYNQLNAGSEYAIRIMVSGGKSLYYYVHSLQPAKTVEISGDYQMHTDHSKTYKVSCNPTNSTDYYQWSSSDKNVATVPAEVMSGKTVSVTTKNKAAAVDLSVQADPGVPASTSASSVMKVTSPRFGADSLPITVGEYIPATQIEVEPETEGTSAKLAVGDTLALKEMTSPKNATKDYDTWESSNKKIATVDDKGVVTGVSSGTVDIICRQEKDGANVYGTYRLTVYTPVAPSGTLQADASVVYIRENNEYTVNITSTTKGADEPLEWTCDNSSIQMTDVYDGDTLDTYKKKISLKSNYRAGTTAHVTVSAEKYNRSTQITFYIVDPLADSDKLDVTMTNDGKNTVSQSVDQDETIDCYIGETMTLKGVAKPAGQVGDGQKDMVDFAYDTEFAQISVNSTDGIMSVTGAKKGTFSVTVSSSSNPKLNRTFRIRVRQVTSAVTLNPVSVNIAAGTVYKDLKLSQSAGADEDILWTTSDSKVATVMQAEDGSISINGLTAGKATITATAKHSLKKATLSVTVTGTSQLTLTESRKVVNYGSTQTVTLTAKLVDEKGNNVPSPNLEWSSDNDTVARWTSSNTSAKSATFKVSGFGKAMVSVKYGETTATCEVISYCPISNNNYVAVSGIEKNYDYNGGEIKPLPVVSFTDPVTKEVSNLKEGKDYTVTYTNNRNAGTAYVKINGAGNFTNPDSDTVDARQISFGINKVYLKNMTISPAMIASQYFTGSAMCPEVSVSSDAVTFIPGVDYTVTYKNNVAVSTATQKASVTLTPKTSNFYSEAVVMEFDIVQRQVQEEASQIRIYDAQGNEVTGDTLYVDVNKNNMDYYTVKAVSENGSCDDIVKIDNTASYSGYASAQFINVTTGNSNVLALTGTRANKSGCSITFTTLGSGISRTMKLVVYEEATAIRIRYANYGSNTVSDVPSEGVSVRQGCAVNFSGVLTPGSSTDELEWSVSDTAKATIDENGKLTAIGKGTIIVYAKTKATQTGERGLVQSATVTLRQGTNHLALDKTELVQNYSSTQKATINASVTDENGDAVTNADIQWTSDNNAVVTVQDGLSTKANLQFKSVGTATITAKIGNDVVAACKVKSYVPVSDSRISITGVNDKTYDYNGAAITPEPQVAFTDPVTKQVSVLKKDKDYTVEYADNTNAGSAKCIVSGLGNYTTPDAEKADSKTVNYTINRIYLSSLTADPLEDQYYTGSEMTPEVVLHSTTTTFVQGIDFTCTYKNNVAEGRADDGDKAPTVEVKPLDTKNFYSDVLKLTFNIVDKTITHPASDIKIYDASGNEVEGNNLYVDVDQLATWKVKAVNETGNCDDIVSIYVTDANKYLAGGFIGVTDGVENTLVLQGKKAGTTSLSFRARSGKSIKDMNVVVYQPAKKLTMQYSSDGKNYQNCSDDMSLISNHSGYFKVKYDPSDCTDTIEWSTSDSSIATVSDTGVLTALAPGNVTLTAKTKATETGERGETIKLRLTITQNNPATSITLDESAITLKAGATKTLKATVLPANNTEQLLWTSADEKVATVSQAGVVTAVGGGSTVVRCSGFDGKIFAECKVNVLQAADKLELSDTEKTLEVGQTLNLTASLTPETAIEQFSWSTSDKAIATVTPSVEKNAAGKDSAVVTALKEGTVTITVKSSSSNLTAKCTINVVAAGTVNQDQKLAAPAKLKLKNLKGKKLKVTYGTVEGAEGYQISYGLKSNFKGAKAKVSKKARITLKKLKKKKTYYVRVRAFKTVDGVKVYGSWSKKAKLKIKK